MSTGEAITHRPAHATSFHAAVLAAGSGARFGGGKLLASWRGRPLIAWAVDAAFAAPAQGVTLVTGCDAPAVEAAAKAAAGERPLRVAHAAGWARGLSASLRAAVHATPAEAVGLFVFLGDMPCIPHGLAARLAGPFLDPGVDAAIPMVDGRRAHPALIGRALFSTVEGLREDRGAGALLAGLGSRLAIVATQDAGAVFDVDTRQSLETGM